MSLSASRNELKMLDPNAIAAFADAALEIQQRSAGRIAPGTTVSAKAARQRIAGGVPALDGETLVVDPQVFRDLTIEMSRLFWEVDRTGESAEKLLADRELALDRIQAFVLQLTAHQGRCLSELGRRTECDIETLTALFQMVLTPFYQKAAEPFREAVRDIGWQREICPVCGARPPIARLPDTNSPRVLFCTLCRTEWPFPRLQCPFCSNTDQSALRYFTVDGDEVAPLLWTSFILGERRMPQRQNHDRRIRRSSEPGWWNSSVLGES